MIAVKINVDAGVIMQKISFLLLGTSLSLMPQTLNAAECAVTDCSLLGYTDSACPGSGLKCPFGDGWYCGGGAAEDCIKLGYDKSCTGAGESGSGETCNGKYQSCNCDSSYKYTCTGTGYSGGSGSACGGKYTKCNCKSPYTWTSGACKCPSTYKYTCSGTGYSGGSGTACGGKYTACTCTSGYEWKDGACSVSRPVCDIGTLYYSDNTCSSNKVSGKTLLGVVIYSNGSSGGGWIMTIKPIATGIKFGYAGADIPELTNYTSTPSDTQSSCTNTTIITNYGNISEYPAAWVAKNYKPSGTPSGKNWCLPSGGLLNNALNNVTNFTKINAGIHLARGTFIGSVYGGTEGMWSSSEYSSRLAWYFHSDTRSLFSIVQTLKSYDDSSYSVRPVMEF